MVANPKTILITGVAGFIGSNLADRLVRQGFRVIGIDNLAYGVLEQVPPEVELHRLDIRSAAIYPLFTGVDAVYHLAAKNCIADCQADPLETCDINVTGTVNVFEAARLAGVGKVIYAESSALYEGSQIMPTPESEVSPQSLYAVSKFAGMAFAEAYRRFFGLRTTALRYFCVYGPRQDYRRTIPPVMSAFIIKLLQAQPPTIYGSGEKRRDFIYVDDVNDFHLLCLEDSRTDGQVYNLGSGVNYSVREIFDTIAQLLDTDRGFVQALDLPGEAQTTLADISAARALGWEPRVSLTQGLQASIEFIRSQVLAPSPSVPPLGVLVLAAGKSTRIQPVSGGRPKPLLEVQGRTVLERNLTWLAEQGLDRVWINLHYRPEEIQAAIGDGSALGLRVSYSLEPEIRGTAGAYKQLEPHWRGPTLVVYGDSLVRFNLKQLWQEHRQSGAVATIALFDQTRHPNTAIAGGRVHLDGQGKVKAFQEGGGDSPLVNAGVYLLELAVLGHIPPGQFWDFGRDLFPSMLTAGYHLQGHLIDGYCLGLDTPDSYACALELTQSEIVKLS